MRQKKVYHIDSFRIENNKQVLQLGFDELIDEPNYFFIEWAEKLAFILPKISTMGLFSTERYLEMYLKPGGTLILTLATPAPSCPLLDCFSMRTYSLFIG